MEAASTGFRVLAASMVGAIALARRMAETRGEATLAEQITLGHRLSEKQTHVLNRITRFAMRQEARNRPAAWQHDCARLVHGRRLRRAERIEAFETLAALHVDDEGPIITYYPDEFFVIGTFTFHPFGGFDSADFSEEDSYFAECCAPETDEPSADQVFDLLEDYYRWLGVGFLVV